MLGEFNAGKTTLLNTYIPLAKGKKGAADFRAKVITIGNKDVNLSVWDTAGQEQFTKLGGGYYRGTTVALFMFDLSDHKSFRELDKWHKLLIEFINCPNPEQTPIVLIGNKSDLQRVVTKGEIDDWCAAHGRCPYFETQAINGTEVDNVFKKIA